MKEPHSSAALDRRIPGFDVSFVFSHIIHWNCAIRVRNELGLHAYGDCICILVDLVSHFEHLLMGIWVQGWDESWTCCWSIFREESTGFIPNTASVTKSFWSHWSCSPLWCLGYLTMHTFSYWWWRALVPCRCVQWSERKGQFDFLVFGILYSRRITVLRHFDQRLGLAKFSASDGAFGASCNCWSGVAVSVTDEAGEMSWIGGRGLKVAGRGRLLRARPRCWPGVATVCSGLLRDGRLLSLEQELLLSSTETGLEVWNWL